MITQSGAGSGDPRSGDPRSGDPESGETSLDVETAPFPQPPADGRAADGAADRAADHAAWAELPRRRKPRRAPATLAVRAPIPIVGRRALVVLSVAGPIAVWAVVAATGSAPATFLPSPAAVLSAGWDMAVSGELVSDLWATLRRVLLGFGLAVLVSVPLGIVIGSYQAAEAAFEPSISLLRYLPASAFVPLIIIWLGIDESSKIAILVIGTIFYNTIMTADAARGVPKVLLDVASTLGARRGEVVRKIIVPHALPGIIDAVRVNVAAAWNLVVVAELVSATAGLGYRIVRAQRFLQTDKIFAVLAVIALAGVLIDVALRLLRLRVGRWTT
ncbi:ABC transporter permease [Pseudonocardia sp. TRM90224]|uniref:ABC transporter permease n=1 Tax=Pseudonocardia sp. TRM90224 TaxID=2812678 RepID=UPI001E3AABBB|nr:ABC transporter permease [Pseudonocardia sp. TRM90224]